MLTNKIFLAIFGALFALLFITLMIVISAAIQVEDLDEKLKYIPPQPKGAEISPKSAAAGQKVYVPVYSHIYAKGGKPFYWKQRSVFAIQTRKKTLPLPLFAITIRMEI